MVNKMWTKTMLTDPNRCTHRSRLRNKRGGPALFVVGDREDMNVMSEG